MNKQVLWAFLVLLIGYLALVFCDENIENSLQIENNTDEIQNESSKDLMDEARLRRKHKFFHLFWGWHALAIAYWIKVKVIIVAFFLGSAVFLGLRYFWPHKCSSGIVHDGPIIYDNPHSFSHPPDHIPYAYDHSDHFDHSFDSGSYGPYSGYADAYSETIPSSVVDASGSPVSGSHHVKKRSSNLVRDQPNHGLSMEEKIADVMFSFLGLDSTACRQRFICEMEFRSKLNPLSSMAFRIVGRGFFNKYTNARNTHGRATSFQECATVNPECIFIEETEGDLFDTANDSSDVENLSTEAVNEFNSNADDAIKTTTSTGGDNKSNEINHSMEAQNEINIANENRKSPTKRRRMHKKLDLVVSQRLLRN